MRADRLHLGEEALVYRLAYNGDVVGFKMGRRQGKRVGGSAYWRIGVSGDAFSQRVARPYHSYTLYQRFNSNRNKGLSFSACSDLARITY